MKTILQISPDINVKGGISSVIKGYLEEGLGERFRIIQTASHVDGSKFIKFIQAFQAICVVIMRCAFQKIDIVHIHCGDIISVKRKYYFFRLVKIFRKPIVLHFHGASFMQQYPETSSAWKHRFKKLFEESDLVVCLSNSWRKSILTLAPKAKTTVLPNAVSLPRAVHWNRRETPPKIVFLGLIGERKGIFDLLHVVRRVAHRGRALTLYIGGNGQVGRLNQEIAALDLSGTVHYLGWISPAARDRLLREAAIYTLPSYAEGMPMSLLEAMSYGLAVMATTVGGIPELIEDGKTGFLTPPGDLDAMEECLTRLIDDTDLRRAIGESARCHIEQQHNLSKMVNKIANIYDCL